MIEESAIGQRIKNFRIKRGVTLQVLTNKTGFTQGYLSKLENSDKAPPISTLIRLAKALDVSLSEIFGETEEIKTVSFVKKNDVQQIIVRDGSSFGYSYRALAPTFYGKHMEPYLLTLPFISGQRPLFQHDGEELIVGLEGQMKFFYGDQEFLVEEGDCLYIRADTPHTGVCVGEKEAKCLVVIYTPEKIKVQS